MRLNLGTFIGATASASTRYLLSTNLGTFFKMTNPQLALFNTLDMAISSIPMMIFDKMEYSLPSQFILGRGLGFLTAATITGLTTGSASIFLLLTVSLVSQVTGFIFTIITSGDRIVTTTII